VDIRLELPREIERFGAVRLGSVQRVFELDSGLDPDGTGSDGAGIEQVPYRTLHEIQRQMAIVVPVRNERPRLIEGVLTGIPHPCLIIVVSNSERQPLEQFEMERDLVERYCRMATKQAMIVHQKDPALADAFRHVGYDAVLDETGEVADGKAEGMMSGILLARLAGRRISLSPVEAQDAYPHLLRAPGPVSSDRQAAPVDAGVPGPARSAPAGRFAEVRPSGAPSAPPNSSK
jgi:mannosyl-3-phosphoglycerate synthase